MVEKTKREKRKEKLDKYNLRGTKKELFEAIEELFYEITEIKQRLDDAEL